MIVVKKVVAFILVNLVQVVMYCFIIPIGLLGVLWGLIRYTFMEGVDVVDEQLEK